MTEAQFQAAVVELARLLGWRTYHTHDSRRSDPGYPDLTLVHRTHGVIWAELKTEKGKPSPTQVLWLEDLNRHGRAYLWRPKDWPEIENVLRGLA